MKRMLMILMALVIAMLVYAGCGNGGDKKDNVPYYPLGYGCIYDNDYADYLDVESDGSALAEYEDDQEITLKSVSGNLTTTEKEDLEILLAAADWSYSESELVFGSYTPGTNMFGIMINAGQSTEKYVIIWGENPGGTPAEYIALRDFLRSLYEAFMQ